MSEDLVMKALKESKALLEDWADEVEKLATQQFRRQIAELDRAIEEHKRTSDLHRLIATTIRQEIATEYNVRRQQALEAFQQAEHTLTLAGFTVPNQGN